MNRKGINYDVGTDYGEGRSSRSDFDHAVVRREIAIIKNDLHCNAIRISGQEIDRLTFATECALRQGMEVWLSPALIDADAPALLAYLSECARAAESLRQHCPKIVFVAGCELSLFMNGIIDGTNIMERIDTISKPAFWIKNALTGGINKPLNAFLSRAAQTIRTEFHGELSYSSGPWEQVDWTPFDLVALDHYRDAGNRNTYGQALRPYFTHGKPVVITEFGCCTYRGAEDKGGIAWAIVDDTKVPRQLKGDYVRDEQVQADTLSDLLRIIQDTGIDGAFVFTFVSPAYPSDPRPQFDLDMASYSLVKTLPDGHGSTYPEMPWEPKAAFAAVALRYAEQD